jgi:alpha/beta superfamily hydrolase
LENGISDWPDHSTEPFAGKMTGGMNATIALAQPVLSQVASKLRSVDLTGPAGRLEAVVNEGAPDAPFAALVCHPHPLGGGNLHNKVVYHTMKVLNEPRWGFNWPVLRFNFRGAGISEGRHNGEAEAGDVLAAIHWLQEEYQRPIVLAGFSFGASMAITACCDSNLSADIKTLVALGLPTQNADRAYRYPFLKDLHVPKLFISGDHDQFAPAHQLTQIVASAADPKKLALIQGSDHFFTGHLTAMQKLLAVWLKEHTQ